MAQVVKSATSGSVPARPAANGVTAPAPAVRIAHLTKSFGRRAVFSDVNFTVAPGELVEIVGPSGAGKTTLLRLIHGQLRPTKGQVWVEGRSLHRWWRRGLGRIRREVSFIYQEQRLLPRLNALENLVYALMLVDPTVPYSRIRRRALEALDAFGLGNRRKSYPSQLSAGERQRIAVARALASRPRVLLAPGGQDSSPPRGPGARQPGASGARERWGASAVAPAHSSDQRAQRPQRDQRDQRDQRKQRT